MADLVPELDFRWRPRKTTRLIVLHDSHTEDYVKTPIAYLRSKGREMGLLDIGYHFVIARDGRLYRCRPQEVLGNHTPGHNHDSIGVCLMGGMECGVQVDNFTEDQRKTLGDLMWSLHGDYGPIPLVGHTELQRFRKRDLRCPSLDMHALRHRLGLPKKEA